MQKKRLVNFGMIGLISLFLIMLNGISLVSAADCNLAASMINQDPYPAVQGDYVKLVFQITGTQSQSCGDIYLQLVPQYPISFDDSSASEITVKGGTFVSDYNSNLVVPFKVRVANDAVDGDNPIKLRYSTNNKVSYVINSFDLNIKDARTKFEAYVKNFDFSTNILTLQVLNSGKSNIEALTIEIPDQTGVVVKGSNRNIVGSLDANEYTTADFEVSPNKADILVNIEYTDSVGVRRQTSTNVSFHPVDFQNRKSETKSNSGTKWIVIIVILVVAYFIYRRYKHNKMKKLHVHS